MKQIALTVNGTTVEALVEPRTHLADFLREQQRLTGTHLGCEQGVCGACTILLNGAPARACLTLAVSCGGADIRTVEGFADDPVMVRLREAFGVEHALQCGFCTPGMLISSYDIVRRLPTADEARIRTELSGNLCRCTGYMGIVAAVKSVIAQGPALRDPAVLPRRRPFGPPLPPLTTRPPQLETEPPPLPTFSPSTVQVFPPPPPPTPTEQPIVKPATTLDRGFGVHDLSTQSSGETSAIDEHRGRRALFLSLSSSQDLRRAIVLREVFGPPRGLQPVTQGGAI